MTEQPNKNTTQQVGNPTGKGGFGDHPENRNPGGWNPDFTFSYQYKRFLNMPADKFLDWDKDVPDSDKKVVEKLAWIAVLKARDDLNERKEVTNRTEGTLVQKQEIAMEIMSLTKEEEDKIDIALNNLLNDTSTNTGDIKK